MKLHNSLTKNTEEFLSRDETISMYSCGPTVYDNLHIGNLSAFIYADVLRRTLTQNFPDKKVVHVMNITDVDDKTIRDSRDVDPNPMKALIDHTRKYEQVFMEDMAKVGNDLPAMQFIRATESIDEMLQIIRDLYDHKVAYIADDGVYFSIEAYKTSGKKYGQLVHIDESSTANSRIQNDEYDKDSAHDFALWKVAKEGEPSWAFELDGHTLDGRPGWHIECSAMSRKLLGQPFDIHTGGIDLKFPHHENEIAQSTACSENPTMASFFIHNEHVLVDGTKMSKSLGNFYTLRDVEQKGFDPLAFRMLVLQGHYRNSVNFSWDNLEAAQNRLTNWRNFAALRWQLSSGLPEEDTTQSAIDSLYSRMSDDLGTPQTIASIDGIFDGIRTLGHFNLDIRRFLGAVDDLLGLDILKSTPDIQDESRDLLHQRQEARDQKDWARSDELRDELKRRGIDVRDDASGQIWSYATTVIDSQYFCL